MALRTFAVVCLLFYAAGVYSQTFKEQYQTFKHNSEHRYTSFRDSCNMHYAEFLLTAWEWFEGKSPLPIPKNDPIPPKPYQDDGVEPIDMNPIIIVPIENVPQPKPVAPIPEVPKPEEQYFSFPFFGNICKVRLYEESKIKLDKISPQTIYEAWLQLIISDLDSAIRDCLECRIRHNLCDWAYIIFLDELSKNFCDDSNSAKLLMAFLYCQSGYQMRLGIDGDDLVLLYGTTHQIYEKTYFEIDSIRFYSYGNDTSRIQICNVPFEGESPMSLNINTEQLLGGPLSSYREIYSSLYEDVKVVTQVPENLIKFFNTYPTSKVNDNVTTRWAMYANTPLSQRAKDTFYPLLRKVVAGISDKVAANKLLNWVQTGFVYEYDDNVWGSDRAFFAEETLYYPYCDCEDRSILFSRLIRDLLNLDVALIYYPGHLATAVCFNEEVEGDSMLINGRKFIVCDPTYIGAPVGAQMPGLDYDKAQAIVLSR